LSQTIIEENHFEIKKKNYYIIYYNFYKIDKLLNLYKSKKNCFVFKMNGKYGFISKEDEYYKVTVYTEINQQIIKKAVLNGVKNIDIRHTENLSGNDYLHSINIKNKKVLNENNQYQLFKTKN